MTDKLRRLWQSDMGYSQTWAIGASPISGELDRIGATSFLLRIGDALYIVGMYASCYALVAAIRRRALDFSTEWLLVVIPAVCLSVIHVFLEVQPRYHSPLMPYIATAMAFTVTTLHSRITSLHNRSGM